MIKVIIFSDIRIYSEGLTKVLSNVEHIQVVGAETSFEGAFKKISQSNPDVVLLDMTMKGACYTGKKIIQCYPEVKVVALSAPEDEKNIIECAEAGVAGYVAREASLDELIDAVKGAEKGEICCPPKITACILNKIRSMAQSVESQNRPLTKNIENNNLVTRLTSRERQISGLMSDGLSNKQISRTLLIEVSTVKNHVHNILVKLDVKSRLQVVSLLQHSNFGQRSRSFGLDHRMEMPS